MKRALVIAVIAVTSFAGCARALASVGATATTSAAVTIESAPAGISVVSNLTLPSISTVAAVSSSIASGTSLGGSSTSSAKGGPASNASLTIYGQSGQAVSMAVPQTFQVIRTGGTEALTVKTSSNSPYSIAGNDVVLGSNVLNSNSMNVDVGGSIQLASGAQAAPGAYAGLLVVVVQYN